MQISRTAISIFILSLCFAFPFSVASAGPSCDIQLGHIRTDFTPKTGRDIGPIEWLRNLKLKIWPSKLLKNFEQEKYTRAVQEIKTSIERGQPFIPDSTESYAALIDTRMEDLKISVQNMDPIFRQKTYALIEKIIQSQSQSAAAYGEDLADVLFRGHFQKPTSFRYLFTHLPKEGASEILLQHIQMTVMIGSTIEIAQLGKAIPQPQSPTNLARLKKFWRDYKEVTIAAVYLTLDIVQSISSHSFSVLLPPLDLYKIKNQRELIEQTLKEHDIAETYTLLSEQLVYTVPTQYYYSAFHKALNWWTIGYVLAPFFTPN